VEISSTSAGYSKRRMFKHSRPAAFIEIVRHVAADAFSASVVVKLA
jgi:hypothetical protein